MCVVIAFYFAPTEIFDDHGYAWFARIFAGIFVVYQQIILIDVAYSWNDYLVEMSGGIENEDKSGLVILVIISSCCILGSISLIGILFWQFNGCSETEGIIAITITLSITATLIQLFATDTGSLITSSIIICYTTYLCYSAVSLYPYPRCNPTISTHYQTITEVCL